MGALINTGTCMIHLQGFLYIGHFREVLSLRTCSAPNNEYPQISCKQYT